MIEDLAQLLSDIGDDFDATLEAEPGRDIDVLTEWFPELVSLCEHVALLELLVRICKARK